MLLYVGLRSCLHNVILTLQRPDTKRIAARNMHVKHSGVRPGEVCLTDFFFFLLGAIKVKWDPGI